MKWNIRERVAELREGVVTVVCRHPLELLLLLALTVTLIVCVETGREPDGARLAVMGWGAFVLLVVNRLTDRSRWHRLYWVAWAPLVPLFLWPGVGDWLASAQGVITMAVLSPLALLACRRAADNARFVTDALVYLRAAVLALLFAGVAYGLFEAILWSAAYIFGFDGARWVAHLTTDLLFVTFLFAAPTLFLMLLDRWEEARFGQSHVLEALVNWVVTPAVVVYAAILYLYLLKILLAWSLPEGGVAYLVFGFTMTALLVKALWMQLEKRRGGWFYDRFSLLSLPLVALFWVGVARRVGEYGLTEARIYLLFCGGVMTLCILLFLSRRTGRYRWVVLAALLLFAAAAYVPALEPGPLALRSQSRRAVRIAAELGRLDAAGGPSLCFGGAAASIRLRRPIPCTGGPTANCTRRCSTSSATARHLPVSGWPRRMICSRYFLRRCAIMCSGDGSGMKRGSSPPARWGSACPGTPASPWTAAIPGAMSTWRTGTPRATPSCGIRCVSGWDGSTPCWRSPGGSCWNGSWP